MIGYVTVQNRYIPVLRWKRGEKTAIGSLSSQGRQDVSPLFILGTDRFVGRDATKKSPPIPAATWFAQEMGQIWGNLPFYLDASAVNIPPSAPHHSLIDIAAQARLAGLALVPATTLAASAPYQAALSAIVSVDGRGLALRIDLQELSSVANWAPVWPLPMADTDLIVDFGSNVSRVDALGSVINPLFKAIYGAGQWRTLTIVGTSMPENFTGYAAGTFAIPRIEWRLWKRLSTIPGLPYRIDYGDYTTVAIAPAPQGIAWGFPINVKYTLANDFLVCRGVKTTGLGAVDMDVQLIGHAGTIVGYPQRSALSHCSGDTQIDDISSGAIGPGNLETWVTIGVNRHVEIVRHLLP
jgi:hypothetical protein